MILIIVAEVARWTSTRFDSTDDYKVLREDLKLSAEDNLN